MIFIYHSNTNIVAVTDSQGESLSCPVSSTIAEGLRLLAQDFRTEKLVWCHIDCKKTLNVNALDTLFHHDKMMLSYCPDNSNYFGETIGYVEESIFVNVNKKVSFPTWQMSSAVGMIHASVLNEIKDSIPFDAHFDYYLCSLSKLCMPLGLLCYSEPKLLKKSTSYKGNIASIGTIFKFVKQHYKIQWIFLLMLNQLLYEKKFSVFPFFFSLWFQPRKATAINLENIKVQSSKQEFRLETIDVVIPTIGRKKYLYDVLCDLKRQIHLPVNVIIVEQNPLEDSESELDYLKTETWPFAIKHTFTHQAGACNARNLALAQVESNWVFLADDDIRFENDFLVNAFDKIKEQGAKAISFRCYQKNEVSKWKTIFQWGSFGSGCSIVYTQTLKNCKFDMGYEFGYGEDNDFGMQIRNLGEDVLYLPEPSILHLKAPMGGFRTKPVLDWYKDAIQPKPSPTVMLYQINHNSKKQVLGYKTILFLKFYFRQKVKNPILYWRNFGAQWNQSVFWANQLNQKK
ncbi:glycosyltransferase [Flavobacterium ovatum]|uniref:glycosyltransferase family 2 protein n=1 Tax=Flavobacterium ovatum TaxID=1928857 RepID=UPI00344BA007